MKLLAISVLSWIAGLGAYLAALKVLWNQSISRGDLRAVAFWSTVAAAAAIGMGFAPVMFALRRRIGARRAGAWLYPVVGMLLGVFPVMFIMGVWSQNLSRALFSPEAGLFFCMFTAFGAIFGGGFYLGFGRRSA